MNPPLHIVDTGGGAQGGLMAYRAAWDLQVKLHEEVLCGVYPAGVLMLVEHPAVITIGRRPDAQQHLLVAPGVLEARGVELVETDRGGDITFHGPGQLVVYPILNLNTYGLNLHAYMRLLETVTRGILAAFNIRAIRVEGCTGVWIDPESALLSPADSALGIQGAGLRAQDAACSNHGLAKICAIGVKLRRWTTLHGLALNVTTDLGFFDLINPCGLSRPVTSMQRLLQEGTPAMGEVKGAVIDAFNRQLDSLGKK